MTRASSHVLIEGKTPAVILEIDPHRGIALVRTAAGEILRLPLRLLYPGWDDAEPVSLARMRM